MNSDASGSILVARVMALTAHVEKCAEMDAQAVGNALCVLVLGWIGAYLCK